MKRTNKPEPPSNFPPAWDADLEPAPGDLGLVQALLNTYEIPTRTDRLATPEAAGCWLSHQQLVAAGTKVSKAERARLVRVRRALRTLVLAHHGKKAEEAVFEDLNRAASGAKLAFRFSSSGAGRLEPEGSGVDGAIARLLLAVVAAQQDGRLKRLKICRVGPCQRVYYDFSRNRSSRWCSERCGNRLSARRFRRRRRRLYEDGRWEIDDG